MVKKNFPLLSVDLYLSRVVTGNRYLPRVSNENALFITSTSNVSVSRWVITLVTIPLLDFVMIHRICWIQRNSFRNNSTELEIVYKSLYCLWRGGRSASVLDKVSVSNLKLLNVNTRKSVIFLSTEEGPLTYEFHYVNLINWQKLLDTWVAGRVRLKSIFSQSIKR